MFNISKKISVIVILLTILSTAVYASYCEYRCVYCGMGVVSGCGSPPSSFGYCPKAPNGMHFHILARQTR